MRLTPREPVTPADRPLGPRRLLRLLAAALVVGSVLLGGVAGAEHAGPIAPGASPQVGSTTTTTEVLAGTTLEADDRDDGTPQARWLIGSGIAAGVAVLVGGMLLKRRMT